MTLGVEVPEPTSAPDRNRRIAPVPVGAAVQAVLGAFVVTAMLVGAVVAAILLIPGGRDAKLPILAIFILLHSVAMLVMLWFVLRRCELGWADVGLVRPGWRFVHLLWQVPLAIVLFVSVQVAFAAASGLGSAEASGFEDVVVGAGGWWAVVVLVCVVTLVPLWEEILFRGVLLGALRRRFGIVISVALSALAFAAAHGFPPLIPYFLSVGIVLALLRVFHGNLWAPVALHASVNALASVSVLVVLLGAEG